MITKKGSEVKKVIVFSRHSLVAVPATTVAQSATRGQGRVSLASLSQAPH